MSDRREPSRAELVRLRREQEKAKRMDRVVKETTRPVTAAPRAKPNTPKKKPVQGTRRRFRIALPAVRPNLRAVHLPRPRFGWRSVSFVLVALLGAALYAAFNLPQLRVVEAQVVGNQFLTPAEVNAVMNIAGEPIFLLSPSDLETRLRLNYPELASVRVSVSLPNLVTVNAVERKPVIRWEQFGSYTWVAEDGVAFRPRGEVVGLISVYAETAPPVGGGESIVSAQGDPLNPAPFISVQMVQAVQGLAAHVPPGQSIVYDERMGFGWDDPRGWRAYFGVTAHDVALKMRVYEAMVDSLTQRGIRPALINVTYPTAPYYRMTQ
jgi:cell division septal protein FtsQ